MAETKSDNDMESNPSLPSQDGMETDAVGVPAGTKSIDKDPPDLIPQQSFAAALSTKVPAEEREGDLAADMEAPDKLIQEQQTRKCQKLEETCKKQLADHQAIIASLEARLASRYSDSTQFKYIIRGCKSELSCGEVSRNIFGAEPESALAHIYDGTWQYAQDAEGRALVNSNPVHWPLILDWLSFGAVPVQPTEAFIAECNYWQLDKLIAAMPTRKVKAVNSLRISGKKGHHFAVSTAADNGQYGFKVQGKFHNFLPRFMKLRGVYQAVGVDFEALGSKWYLKVSKHIVSISLVEGHDIRGSRVLLDAGNSACPVARNLPADHLFKAGGAGYGFFVDRLIQENQFTHVKHVDVHGALPLSFTLLFH